MTERRPYFPPRAFESSAKTSPEGTFRIGGLPGGEVSIRIAVGMVSRDVEVLSGQDLVIEDPLRIEGWERLDGQVDGAANLGGRKVSLHDRTGAYLSGDVLDRAGRFSLWGVRPGRTYSVRVESERRSPWTEIVEVRDTSDVVQLSVGQDP